MLGFVRIDVRARVRPLRFQAPAESMSPKLAAEPPLYSFHLETRTFGRRELNAEACVDVFYGVRYSSTGMPLWSWCVSGDKTQPLCRAHRMVRKSFFPQLQFLIGTATAECFGPFFLSSRAADRQELPLPSQRTNAEYSKHHSEILKSPFREAAI